MRFLLRPGWIALTVAVAVFAFACYYLLAPWQFHRGDERSTANERLATAQAEPAVPRSELVEPGAAPDPDDEWRRVTVSGQYLPGDALARLRTIEGAAASEVLTALRTDDGRTLLVDRGYVRAGDDGALPAIPPAPAGPVALTGHLRSDERPAARPPILDGPLPQVYSVESGGVAAVLGTPLEPGYLQLVADQPGAIEPVPLPPTDPNPSYSYAWQWLLFGLMALGAWVHFARMEYRRRPGGPDDDGDDTGVEARQRRRRARFDPRDSPDGTPWDAAGSPEGSPHDSPDPSSDRAHESRAHEDRHVSRTAGP